MERQGSMAAEATTGLQVCDYLNDLEAEHLRWLGRFDVQHGRNFTKLRNADFEAAMTEAAVRQLLQQHGLTVEPAEDVTGKVQRPDFLCTTATGERFYVEATCISIQRVIEETGLPHHADGRARNFSPLNDAFWSACKGKTTQCGNLDHPALVAIGTHHLTASTLCVSEPMVDMLLTGTTMVSWRVNARTGLGVSETYLSTGLHSAAFLRSNPDRGIGFARSSISGLLLCGFGVVSPRVLGILHPNPARKFGREHLAGIPFCEVEIDRSNGTLSTRWDEGRID